MTEEQYCLDAIANLQREFEKAAKPFVDRLVYLKSIEQPRSFIISKEQYEAAHGIKE